MPPNAQASRALSVSGDRQYSGPFQYEMIGSIQSFKRQSHLICGSKDGGFLGAPVIGVLVGVLLPLQQCTSFCQSFYDCIIALALHLHRVSPLNHAIV